MRPNPMHLIVLPLLAAMTTPAMAADNVSLSSKVFVARDVRDAAGETRTVLMAPGMVTPGDRLVITLDYRNRGATPATDFVVVNPIPAAVAYADRASAGEQVSVDGGTIWGALSALRVPAPDGRTRSATAAEVTHIRWTMKTIPAGGGGKLQFNGVVR